MKFSGRIYWLRNTLCQDYCPAVLSFEKGFIFYILLSSIDQQAKKRICIGIWICEKSQSGLRSEEKDEATFVVADHHSSVSVPVSTMNCQDSYPRYQNM